MPYVFISVNILVFVIGIIMLSKYYKSGLWSPPVMSGVAFILISVPGILSLINWLFLGPQTI